MAELKQFDYDLCIKVMVSNFIPNIGIACLIPFNSLILHHFCCNLLPVEGGTLLVNYELL